MRGSLARVLENESTLTQEVEAQAMGLLSNERSTWQEVKLTCQSHCDMPVPVATRDLTCSR